MKKGNNIKNLVPHVVIFVEGDTDEVVFSRLVDYYRANSSTPIRSCEIQNMKGVGRYASSKFIGKLEAEIIPKSKKRGMKIYGVSCSYATDVFENEESPIVDWNKLKKSILRLGIEEFCRVEVKSSIEDWLLDDIEGLCKFLKLKEVPKYIKGENGYAKLLNLFKRSGRVYAKGLSIEDFIDYLSIETIRNKRKNELYEVERLLNATIAS